MTTSCRESAAGALGSAAIALWVARAEARARVARRLTPMYPCFASLRMQPPSFVLDVVCRLVSLPAVRSVSTADPDQSCHQICVYANLWLSSFPYTQMRARAPPKEGFLGLVRGCGA